MPFIDLGNVTLSVSRGACTITVIIEWHTERKVTWTWDRERVLPTGEIGEHPFPGYFMEQRTHKKW